MKREKNIKYGPTLEAEGRSFFLDHVHIRWDNQITLHQQDSWELSYVITGRGVRAIGDIIEPFIEGEVILIPPHIPHCWTFDESVHDSEGKIENITIAFYDKLLEESYRVFPELSDVITKIRQKQNAISFSGETLAKLQTVMTSMVSESYAERVSSLIRILNLIASPDTADIVGRPVMEDKKARKMQLIYLYVMNNYQRNISLDEIAQFAGMEKASFCVFFKKMANKPFFSFLTEYRIGSSCQMLLKTSDSISEICIASGFRDVPYFNRVFKKAKNMTPGEYRKNHQMEL